MHIQTDLVRSQVDEFHVRESDTEAVGTLELERLCEFDCRGNTQRVKGYGLRVKG